jgi:hypothetical protein
MFSLSSLQTRNDQNVITNMAEIEQWNQKDVTARNYIFATLAKPICTLVSQQQPCGRN